MLLRFAIFVVYYDAPAEEETYVGVHLPHQFVGTETICEVCVIEAKDVIHVEDVSSFSVKVDEILLEKAFLEDSYSQKMLMDMWELWKRRTGSK